MIDEYLYTKREIIELKILVNHIKVLLSKVTNKYEKCKTLHYLMLLDQVFQYDSSSKSLNVETK